MQGDTSAQTQRFMPRVVGSLVGHALVVLLLSFWPSSAPPALPPMVTVELIASLPTLPAPKAPAAIAKPKPVQKQVVLPKRAPAAVPKKPRPKPVKRPAKVQRPQRPEPEPALDYDDTLALLRLQQGEQRPDRDVDAEPAVADAEPNAQGVRLSPEALAWRQAARRHVRARWITPPEFLDRGLSTQLLVELTRDGHVVGTPEVVGPSGDPFWDDNTVRAILSASPLPPPPRAGKTNFEFIP